MLLLLMPEQVSAYWEDIKDGMSRALPPGAPDRDQRLLAKILQGLVQVWVSYQKGEEGAVVDGAVLTTVVEDHVHDSRSLLLYALWAISETHPATWQEGLEALRKYATGRRCNRLTGYIGDETMLEIAKGLGFDTTYTFVTLDI